MADTSFSLKDVEAVAEVFSTHHLERYVEEVKSPERTFARKEINDALWGTIALTPVEVALLDSPLIQRLRSIRQLGVVHWVYPGAVHTRFEHTLGVLHQVQHLISALNALGAQRDQAQLISASLVQLLRLCALVHDVGHAAFSHVSEMALESLPEINPISAEFSRQYRAEGRSLSEIFAFYIIRSKAMRALFNTLLDRYGDFVSLDPARARNLELIIEKLGLAIIGQKIDDRLPLLHEIISGPFDADKLDYFVRDARLAGTPTVLDISRLVQKISIRELDAGELPAEIARNVNQIKSKYCLFGIKWSGVAMLDELHLARVLLYAKIYRHPKVIAIEQMLRAAIITIAKLVSVESVLKLMYAYDDDALLGMTREGLALALMLDLNTLEPDASERLSNVITTLHDIKARRLAVKAFEIHRRYPADPQENADAQKNGLTDFREEVEHPQQREAFRIALLDEIENITKLALGASAPSRIALDSAIMIHTLGQTPGGSQIARAYLLPSSGPPMPFREYTVNRAAWADSYMSDQPSGFVFAPPFLADAVFIAVEKLLRLRNQVRLPHSALEASKRDPERIQLLKRKVASMGYYRKVPFDIRPVPERLRRADVAGVLTRWAGQLALYQEPQVRKTEQVRPLSPQERTIFWLRQFDHDEHIDCALKLIDGFRMISRSDTVDALRTFVERNVSFRGAVIVPFGSARDSSAIHTYFSADLTGTYISGCKTLDQVAKGTGSEPIIFIDDFIGSGGQGQDILAAGFGVNSLRKSLGEERDLFDGPIQAKLRAMKLGFVFTAAWDVGIANIKKTTKDLGLNAEVYRHIGEGQIPFAFETVLSDLDPEVRESFRHRCAEIGTAIIMDSLEREGRTDPGERDQKATKRRLGYGNRGMLLASPFNVPTQTLTLFWGEGKIDGVPWIPLMMRRKKA